MWVREKQKWEECKKEEIGKFSKVTVIFLCKQMTAAKTTSSALYGKISRDDDGNNFPLIMVMLTMSLTLEAIAFKICQCFMSGDLKVSKVRATIHKGENAFDE